MEPEINEQSNPERRLVNNNRNSIRGLALQSALQITDESIQYVLSKFIYNAIKLSICMYILKNHQDPLEKPLLLFVKMIIAVEIVLCVGYIIKALGILLSITSSIRIASRVVENISLL